ncbi:MAG: hypothetical protein JXA60_10440 [Candidatus Coatesbacteria bacterium]|nr:hypothetical protein [Candidatus Coatesbacteria bacterium]
MNFNYINSISLNCPNCGGTLSLEDSNEICDFCNTPVLIKGLQKREVIRNLFNKAEVYKHLKSELKTMDIENGFIDAINPSNTDLLYIPFWEFEVMIGTWRGNASLFETESETEIMDKIVVKTFRRRVPAVDLDHLHIKGLVTNEYCREKVDYKILNKEGIVLTPVLTPEAARKHLTDDFFLKSTADKSIKSPESNNIMNSPVVLEESIGLLYYPLWVFRIFFEGKNYLILVDGVSKKIIYALLQGKGEKLFFKSIIKVILSIFLLTTLCHPEGLMKPQSAGLAVLFMAAMLFILPFVLNNNMILREGKSSFIDDTLFPFLIEGYKQAKENFIIEIRK